MVSGLCLIDRWNSFSYQIFTEVGNSLSQLRKEDFVQDFGPSSSTRVFKEPTDDPSQFSSKLREKLQENKIIADESMKSVLMKVRLLSITPYFLNYRMTLQYDEGPFYNQMSLHDEYITLVAAAS